MPFYNHTEIYNPILSFFPELTTGKVYKMTMISELDEFDINAICQAQSVNEILQDEFSELEITNEVIHSTRYFPNLRKKEEKMDFDAEAETFTVIDDLIAMKDSEYQLEDFIVSENILYLKEDIICSIATVSTEEPPNLKLKITSH